jgi:hypothetical protein
MNKIATHSHRDGVADEEVLLLVAPPPDYCWDRSAEGVCISVFVYLQIGSICISVFVYLQIGYICISVFVYLQIGYRL